MIIILTGPSGVGKSEVAASIVCHQYFERMVNIESDFFSLKKPFDWFDKETMEYVYEAISNMIQFHLVRNEPNFVTTLSWPHLKYFNEFSHYFYNLNHKVYCFRLLCSPGEMKKRILGRNRGGIQMQQELKKIEESENIFNGLFPDNSIFYQIDTNSTNEDETANIIVDVIKGI